MRSRLLVVLSALASVLAVLVAAPPAGAVTTASAPEAAPGGATGTTRVVTLEDGRTYRLFTPKKPAARPGLVVVLHGYTGNAKGMESYTGVDLNAGKSGNYVAYGEGVGTSWNAGTCCYLARDTQVDDVAYLDRVLDDVKTRSAVTEGRVVLAGYSNGAMMAYRYSCARPERVNTIIPVSGTSVSPCSRTAPVSAFAVHGALDVTVPWLGTNVASAVLGGILPSVPSVLGGVAALDGCGGFVQDKTPYGVDRWTAQTCPSGVQVVAMRSPNMAHIWPSGSAAKSTYGVDATALVWSVAADRWR
jgi:polyhydroxybutyrate depolymerase